MRSYLWPLVEVVEDIEAVVLAGDGQSEKAWEEPKVLHSDWGTGDRDGVMNFEGVGWERSEVRGQSIVERWSSK